MDDTEPLKYDSVDFYNVLRGLIKWYANADRHWQWMLYDDAVASPDDAIRDLVVFTTRRRPTGSIHRNLSHFEHK